MCVCVCVWVCVCVCGVVLCVCVCVCGVCVVCVCVCVWWCGVVWCVYGVLCGWCVCVCVCVCGGVCVWCVLLVCVVCVWCCVSVCVCVCVCVLCVCDVCVLVWFVCVGVLFVLLCVWWFIPKLKCPYYGLKGSYFGFGSRQQQFDMHGRWKKHFHFLIISICVYLICSMTPKRFAQRIIFPNPSFAWRDANLRWLVDFIKHSVCELLTLQKQHLVARNEFVCSFKPTGKDPWVGNMLMFHVDIDMF